MTTRTTTRTTTTTTRTRTRTRTRRRTRSNNNNDDNEDAARSMSCPQVQMTSPSLFPSPDPYRHRRCAKLYNIHIDYTYSVYVVLFIENFNGMYTGPISGASTCPNVRWNTAPLLRPTAWCRHGWWSLLGSGWRSPWNIRFGSVSYATSAGSETYQVEKPRMGCLSSVSWSRIYMDL